MDNNEFEKGLYLVATPIGNLGDISNRAIEVLKNADEIACEDTRVSSKLLSYLGIKAKTFCYHEYNADQMRPKVIEKLKNGEMIALISDAGTPLVSDPGYRLVGDCIENDIYFTAIPGASAVLTALQLSGLPSNRWMFEGFLPSKEVARDKELALISNIPATLIIYESPNRLVDTISAMAKILGNRPCAVVREITKKFEEAVRMPLNDLEKYYKENGAPKGEIVIVVGAPLKKEFTEEEINSMLVDALNTMRVKEAAAFVADKTGLQKKELYNKALKLQNNK